MRKSFFKMTVQIGNEMDRETHVFDTQIRNPFVLDLCMAPGGFTKSAIQRFPKATVHAITLPADSGGHHVIATGTNLEVLFADITMFAADFGVDTIPNDHPDARNFRTDRPYCDSQYDLVFCGGAVRHTQERAKYRENIEGARLTLSQLIFAFNRIKNGGSLVLLLHRAEAGDTARLIHTMSTLADIQLFKPSKTHAIKSSFYLVAKNVQSETKEASVIVSEWKKRWYQMTFAYQGYGNVNAIGYRSDEEKNPARLVDEFGPRLVELGNPIWEIQANALEDSDFLKARKDTR